MGTNLPDNRSTLLPIWTCSTVSCPGNDGCGSGTDLVWDRFSDLGALGGTFPGCARGSLFIGCLVWLAGRWGYGIDRTGAETGALAALFVLVVMCSDKARL